MAEDKAVRSLCALLKKLLKQCDADIKRDKKTIDSLEAQIEKLKGQSPPNTALIHELEKRLDALEQQLKTDQGQCEAIREEISASCSP
jgi:chromosome segregation ATPase